MSNERKKKTGGMGWNGMAMGGVEKAKDFKGTMKKLINYLRPYRLSILLVYNICHRKC